MTRFMFALVILITLTFCSKAEDSSGNILVLGDSLSAPFSMELQQGWVHLLQLRLQEQGYDYIVYNASVGGATSGDALARLRTVLPAQQPVIAIVGIGGNDGLRGQPLPGLRKNLRTIVDKLQAADVRVLLLPMHIPDNYGKAYSEGFAGVYTEVIAEYDLPAAAFLLEGVHDRPRLMHPDRIHPTVAAQPRILENLWPAIQPLL